jgi:hypothetical protein
MRVRNLSGLRPYVAQGGAKPEGTLMRSTIHLGGLILTVMLLGGAARLSAFDQHATKASQSNVPERTAAASRVSPASPIDIDGIAAPPFLAENAWDFNAPTTVPGFGPITPQAVEQVLRHSR